MKILAQVKDPQEARGELVELRWPRNVELQSFKKTSNIYQKSGTGTFSGLETSAHLRTLDCHANKGQHKCCTVLYVCLPFISSDG